MFRQISAAVSGGDQFRRCGRKPRNAGKEEPPQIPLCFCQNVSQSRSIRRVDFVLRFGQGVFCACKYRSLCIFVERSHFQRTEDYTVFREDQIGILAHDFCIQYAFAGGKIACAKKFKTENALEVRHGHFQNFCALQMFAQQHTEVGRDKRIFALVFGEVCAAIPCIRTQNQFQSPLTGVYNKREFFARRLIDAVDPSAFQRFV